SIEEARPAAGQIRRGVGAAQQVHGPAPDEQVGGGHRPGRGVGHGGAGGQRDRAGAAGHAHEGAEGEVAAAGRKRDVATGYVSGRGVDRQRAGGGEDDGRRGRPVQRNAGKRADRADGQGAGIGDPDVAAGGVGRG